MGKPTRNKTTADAIRKNKMKHEDEHISFYHICSEMLEEKEGKFSENRLTNFRKELQSRFIEILTQAGINPDSLRKYPKGPFLIPISEKEYVKELLKNYTTPTIVKIRNKDYDKVSSNELSQLIEQIEPLVKTIPDANIKLRELSKLYITTGYLMKAASEDAFSKIQPLIEKDINRFKPDGRSTFYLNDSDAAYLLHYYKLMLEETSRRWNEIVEIVSDLREEELLDFVDLGETTDGEIGMEEDISLKVNDVTTLIWEANQIRQSELKQRLSTILNKPSSKNLEHVKEIIQQLKKDTPKTKNP